MIESPLIDSGLAVPVFSPRDDLIACLNKPKQSRNAAWYNDKAMLAEAQEAGLVLDEEQLPYLEDPGVPDGQALQTIIPNNAASQTTNLDTYDFNCDDILNAKVVLMANISIYGSNVISDEKANKEQNNKSVTAELERYKERVKTIEQRLNIDLSSREKMIDSQTDDMIKEKLALKEQVDSLEQNLLNKSKKRKEIVDIAAQKPSANIIVPGMNKLDLEPLAPRIEVFY
nr:hypothetical protein [Tanacetum cinerariifolium]